MRPHLRRVYALNHEVKLVADDSPAPVAEGGEVIVVADVSASMVPYQDDLRIGVSAVKCCTTRAATHTILHLPAPSGGTHLVSGIESIVAGLPAATKVVLLTDGEDTEWARTRFPVGHDPTTGALVHREVHSAVERR